MVGSFYKTLKGRKTSTMGETHRYQKILLQALKGRKKYQYEALARELAKRSRVY